MPYPSQINPTQVVSEARRLIAEQGVDQVSLASLATVLNVKAPSLYRYFPSKAALIQAVNTATVQDLIEATLRPETERTDSKSDTAELNADGIERIFRLAQAYREFALANPDCYVLAFDVRSRQEGEQVDAQYAESLVIPLQRIVAHYSGEAQSLTSLRGLLAIIHGFVMLEIAGQFRRGGDLTDAYRDSVKIFLRGMINN